MHTPSSRSHPLSLTAPLLEIRLQAKNDFASRGIVIEGGIKVDLAKMMDQKTKNVSALTGGIEGLFKKNKVDYLKGYVAALGFGR